MSDTNISSTLRRGERSRAVSSVIPSNFGRNTLRTSCCVIVLPPAIRIRRPVAYENAAPPIADRIDAGMLVEPAILDREHGLDHPRLDGGQRHRPPLLALAGD